MAILPPNSWSSSTGLPEDADGVFVLWHFFQWFPCRPYRNTCWFSANENRNAPYEPSLVVSLWFESPASFRKPGGSISIAARQGQPQMGVAVFPGARAPPWIWRAENSYLYMEAPAHLTPFPSKKTQGDGLEKENPCKGEGFPHGCLLGHAWGPKKQRSWSV